MTATPNHALQRTRPSRPGCNRTPWWAGSLSLNVLRQDEGCFNVASEELMRSWKQTEGFLVDARSHFSEAAEGICEEELREFDGALNHNELELALDMLEAAFEKSSFETLRVLELMALAAASMGLLERQQRYDRELTNARGWKYETVLPP